MPEATFRNNPQYADGIIGPTGRLLYEEGGLPRGTLAANLPLAVAGGASGNMSGADKSKLNGVEAGATADMTPAEVEAAYNIQVAIMSQAEAEAGTSTTVRRVTAEVIKNAILALAPPPGTGEGGMTNAEVEAAYNAQVAIMTQAEAEAGVSTAVRRITAERIKQAILALAPIGGALFISVKEHGATGNGTTNDAPACQAALDAAVAAGGGVVMFPGGTYRIAVTLTVGSNTTVLVGAGATVIAANALNADLITTKTGSHSRIRVTGSGGVIDGNKANQTSGLNLRCLYLPNVTDTVVDGDLTVQNATGHGIHFSLTGTQRGNRVESIKIRNCGAGAANAGGSGLACTNMLDFRITNLESTGNMRAGVRPDGANIIITGGLYEGNANGGIVPVSTTTEGLTITGSICRNNTGDELADGIRVVDVTRVAISNVICDGNDGSGLMLLNGVKRCTVTGGIFRNNGQNAAARAATSGRDGVTIKGSGGEDITVNGIVCNDVQGVPTQEYGLTIEGDANWVTVGGGCNIRGSAQTILNTSTGTSNRILHGIAGLPHDAALRASVTVTGTTAETNMISQTMPANTFGVRGHMRIRGAGQVSGGGGVKTIRFRLGSLASIVVSGQAAADQLVWSFEAEVLATASNGARVHLLAYEGGAAPLVQTQHVASSTIDWTAAQDVRCTAQLGAAGDSVTQLYMAFEVLA